MANFKDDLARGKKGEDKFLKANPHLERLDGRKGDFFDPIANKKIELKTDFYDMAATPNFFFERFSDIAKGKPGGAWQALEHGADIFIYFFVFNSCYFVFDVDTLVKELELITKTLKPKQVFNSRWTTTGFAVPRAALAHIMTEIKIKKGNA